MQTILNWSTWSADLDQIYLCISSTHLTRIYQPSGHFVFSTHGADMKCKLILLIKPILYCIVLNFSSVSFVIFIVILLFKYVDVHTYDRGRGLILFYLYTHDGVAPKTLLFIHNVCFLLLAWFPHSCALHIFHLVCHYYFFSGKQRSMAISS